MKWNPYLIAINLFKFLNYLSIALLILSIYNYIFGNPILLDSNNNTEVSLNESNIDTTNNSDNNNTKFRDIPTPPVYSDILNPKFRDIPTPPVYSDNLYQKTRRWLHWRFFVNRSDRYQSYDEFQTAWTPDFSLRKTILLELKRFKENPLEYIQEDRNNLRKRILEDKAFEKSTNYVEGRGWLTRSGRDYLARQGYEVLNSKIVKIKK